MIEQVIPFVKDFQPTPVEFICFAVVFSAVVHFLFRRREPSAFEYLKFQCGCFLFLFFLAKLPITTSLLVIILQNVLLGIQIIVYRLLWHDLRKVPGPKLAAVTQAWILKEAYVGNTRFTMKKLSENYGDWVRIGPNELFTTSLDALHCVFGPKGWAKGSAYDSGITKGDGGGDSLLTIKTLPEHASRRRIWDKAFTSQAIQGYVPSVEARVEQLVEVIESHVKSGKDVDLCSQIGYFVYDTMCDMAFGSTGGADLLKNQCDKNHIIHRMVSVVRQVGILRNMPWLTPLFKTWSISQTKEQSKFRNFTKSMFLRRWKQGSGNQLDVFHYLLGEDTETGTRLTLSELVADSTLLIITGADTTKMILIALFLFLLRNPSCMEKLQEELEATPDISPSMLSQLPYLNACIQETMRLQPPSPSNIQRVCPPEGALIDGLFIPGGTKVRFSMYATQRDGRYFYMPEEFRPERWLNRNPTPDGVEAKVDVLNEKAFFAFLIGPGSCVGKSLAWMEMRLVVANLLSNYDLSFAEGFDPDSFERTWTDAYLLLIEEPLLINFTPRLKRSHQV